MTITLVAAAAGRSCGIGHNTRIFPCVKRETEIFIFFFFIQKTLAKRGNIHINGGMLEERARENLIEIADRYEAATGIGRATIGKRALNDTGFFPRLAKSETTFTLRTFDRLVEWFSANWPEGAEWPADLPRPDRPREAAE